MCAAFKKKYIFIIISIIFSGKFSISSPVPDEITGRMLRSVYYESELNGSVSLKITVNNLLDKKFSNGMWEKVNENEWLYNVVDGKNHYKFLFIYIKYFNYHDGKNDELVLYNFFINDKIMTKKEIFDFILPYAVEIYYELNKN